MAKSKEQCTLIIDKNFDGLTQEKKLLKALEESIKEICSSEFGILWHYDENRKEVYNLMQEERVVLKLNSSLLEQTILSKEGFFDNHIASHRKFNPILDNPLNINMKSLLMTPVITVDNRLLGVIATFSSHSHPEEFQRYDLRCLKLLNRRAIELLSSDHKYDEVTPLKSDIEKVERVEVEKKESMPLSTPTVEIKKSLELESLLKEKEQKIETLEQELKVKIELLEKEEEKIKELEALQTKESLEQETLYDAEVVEEDVPDDSVSRETETIVNFLSNEVTYLANDEYKIYLFLEIIKRALHDKEQLSFINNELDKSDFIKKLANDLYEKEKFPLQVTTFNTYQMISNILDLYSNICKGQGILFHVYISPHIPSQIEADEEKLKSLLVHLINNAYGLVGERGSIELLVSFSDEQSSLEIEVRALKAKESKGLFSSVRSSHSLIKGKNTGLGLSVSSNLVNLLGGKLKLSTIGKEEHSFEVNLPIVVNKVEKKSFHSKVPLKIGILADESNDSALKNLEYYLASFSVNKSNILIFKSHKKIGNIKLSHLFCFENMLSTKLNTASSSNFIILKYSQESMAKKYNFKRELDELLVNCYYGTELEQILFPNMKVEEVERVEKDKGILERIKGLYS